MGLEKIKYVKNNDSIRYSWFCILLQANVRKIQGRKGWKTCSSRRYIIPWTKNDLPKEYAPKEVIAMLNPLRNRIICVRGNCDTEVDQMVLDFNVLAEQAYLNFNNYSIVLAHGHKLDEKNIPALCDGDILLCGHTHVPKCEKRDGYIYMNPGSVSIPKENSAHSYMILEDRFYWKDIEDGSTYMNY